MAVVLSGKICISNNCKDLTFVETTGAYNSLSNTTGWGSPNEATSAATSATLSITDTEDIVTNIDLLATTLFPSSNINLQYDLSTTGLTDSEGQLPDGIYTFTYTVVTATTTYTTSWRQAIYCQVKCCVMSMLVDLDFDCDCYKDEKDKIIDSFLMYKGLIYSSNRGNITKFNEQLAILEKLCLNSNCNNCK